MAHGSASLRHQKQHLPSGCQLADASKERRRETGVFASLKQTKFRTASADACDTHRLLAFVIARPQNGRYERMHLTLKREVTK